MHHLPQIQSWVSVCAISRASITNTSIRLDRLKERKIFGRNDALYAKYLFKSRWQPLPAYIGIIGCAFVVAWTGVTPILLLIAKRRLTASLPENPGLKSTTDLVVDVFGAYIGVSMNIPLT